ncbi:MAG: hypothetical protein ABSF50_18130, partial [Burkholderiaceae bacterium]
MIAPENFDYQSLTTTGSPSSGGTTSRLLWLGMMVMGLTFIVHRAGLAWLLALQVNPFLLLFVVLALASIVWSIDPVLTFRRNIRLCTIVLVCAAFVLTGWHARRFQNTVRPLLTIMLAGSIAFGLMLPNLAIHQELAPELAGAWRGLATHKNGLGALAGFALIFWFHAWLAREVTWFSALAA